MGLPEAYLGPQIDAQTMRETATQRSMKRYIQLSITTVIGIAVVYYFYQGSDWSAIMASMRHANPVWLLVTLAFVLGSFFTRVQRWSYIVRVAKPVRFRHMFSATQVGFMVNFTLPGRLGEIVRAVLLSRLAKLPFPKTVAMVAVDRITDLVGLIVVMGIAIIGYPIRSDISIPANTVKNPNPIILPQTLIQKGELSAGVFLVALVAVLVALYLKQGLVIRWVGAIVGVFSKKFAHKAQDIVQHFAEGLHIFRNAGDLTKSLLWSLATWGCFVGGLLSMMQAFNLAWPWYAPFVCQTLLAICMAIPVVPGLLGQFHLPIIIGIVTTIPKTPLSEAQALAWGAYFLNIVPIALSGIICLYLENVGLFELRREVKLVEDELHHPGASAASSAPSKEI